MNSSAAATPAGNDRNAAGQLLETQLSWLRTVLYSRLGRADWVDEALQETSLAFWRAWEKGGVAAWEPWLHRVAANQAMMLRRRLGRARRLEERARTLPCPHGERSVDPALAMVSGEERDALQQLMRELPAKDRELLMLKHVEGWDYRRMAATLGLSESAVATRLHRARQLLRSRWMKAFASTE